jgi:serine/threonine-protein kinase
MPDEAPRQYGKCKVVDLLGQGATAMVYLAKHEGLDMLAAVKVLRRKLSERRPEYAERFLREARTAASLDHPNLVRVIDCGVEQGYHYMVMDYVDGPDCLEMLADHRTGLDWQEAIRIVQQAADALAYAASRNVIHRDVKPSNLMIDRSGRVRVTDLGLAKLTIKGMVSLTQELHTVGTPNYMSPEQIRSPSDLDLRTDIYSLGATFYHLVTGQPPFIGKTPMEVISQHLSSPLVPPLKLRPDLPPPVSSVICKMMAKLADERYQSYDELSRDLQNLLEGKEIAAAGFEETGAGVGDDKELRRLLDELSFGTELKVDKEEPPTEAAARAGAPTREDQGSTELAPFGPSDFRSYSPPSGPAGDSTALAQALLKRKQKQKQKKLPVVPILVGAAVLALLALIVIIALLL